jgi:formylglycine-generating enzyme required for sulfatase activity
MRDRMIRRLTLIVSLYATGLPLNRLAAGEPAAQPDGTANLKSIRVSLDMELIAVPAGEFLMGSPQDTQRNMDDERQHNFPHHVKITRPFYLGKYEVTKRDFAAFVADTGYKTDAERNVKPYMRHKGYDAAMNRFRHSPEYTWRHTGFPYDDDHPVVNVSWNDAVEFCNWLSLKEGRPEYYEIDGTDVISLKNRGYRLPTEAEWEYACRAGTKTVYCNGDDRDRIVEVGNVADATLKEKFPNRGGRSGKGRDGYVFTAPVGKFKPNAFGLYDMHGNVEEWCGDWYGPKYYENSPENNPRGPATGEFRIHRGGGWETQPYDARSASRRWLVPWGSDYRLGFRIARDFSE